MLSVSRFISQVKLSRWQVKKNQTRTAFCRLHISDSDKATLPWNGRPSLLCNQPTQPGHHSMYSIIISQGNRSGVALAMHYRQHWCLPQYALTAIEREMQGFTIFTLRAKFSGAVYCNRSCLWVCLFVCVCGSVTTNSKLRASIFTKLGL